MQYKVIKPFGKAVKGDIFENTEDVDIFELSKVEDNKDYFAETYMSIDTTSVNNLVQQGFLEELEQAECACDCAKLAKVTSKINELLGTYAEDYKKLMEQYNEGEVPQCVKVEAETVYTNLTKVLQTLKNIVNE